MSDESLDWEPHDRHWIRLRGPWTVCWLSSEGVAPLSRRVTLPCAWEELFGNRLGTARFERSFQKPTNLDSHERVVITLCEVRSEVSACLNDTELQPLRHPLGDPASVPADETISFDITPLLQATNRLTLDLTLNSLPSSDRACGLWRPVLLEVIMLD